MLSDVIDPGWLRIDKSVEAFEQAWNVDAVPEIRKFLPPDDHPQFRQTLVELIRVDLELRWQHGCQISLDSYHAHFPELLTDSESISLVAFEEFRARRNAGESVNPVEYERRLGIRIDQWPMLPLSHENDRLSSGSTARRAHQPSSKENTAAADLTYPRVGEQILNFSLQRELGRGAFSRVYLARQGDLADRQVVLKISAHSFSEADKIAKLQHANIVPIYSVHQWEQMSAVCMPYFGATTLSDVVSVIRGKLTLPQSAQTIAQTIIECSRRAQSPPASSPLCQVSPTNNGASHKAVPGLTKGRELEDGLQGLSQLSYVEAVLRIAAKLADGLHHAHQRGIVHRDLKPANVLLADDGQPMVLDFNLSEDIRQISGDALVGGTLPYMSPEQIDAFRTRSRCGDSRSDLYSLGVIMFELLSGECPFAVGERTALEPALVQMSLDRRQRPPVLRSSDKEVTPAVAAMIRRCLDPDPAGRYQTAAELHEDIERHLKQLPLRHTREPSIVERCRKWVRRHSRLAAMIGVIVFATGISLSFERYQKQRRVHALEAEVNLLVKDARKALDDNDPEVAYGRFKSAWMKVQAEPALLNYQLGVAGWLEHSRMAVAQQQWRRRPAPREFDDTRDEALLLSVLCETTDQVRVADAYDAIRTALQLTIQGDPGWNHERELLILAKADLIELHESNSEVLAYLNSAGELSSRSVHRKRSELLGQSGRTAEARKERALADQHPAEIERDNFLNGIANLRRHQFAEALQDLEQVLATQPDNFLARLCESICFMNLNRPAEARVALTACIAQRPHFLWSYLFRSEVSLAFRDERQAVKDLETLSGAKCSQLLVQMTLDVKSKILPVSQ